MDDRIQTLIRQLPGREPTAEDHKRILTLASNLPKEMLASPAALADLVLRTDQLRQFEAAIDRATWDAQQRLQRDLPDRIDKAALAALNKIRDYLPIDSRDAVNRMLKWVTIWTAIVVCIATTAGWTLRGYAADRDQSGQQAAAERSFNPCIDAADGFAMMAKPGVSAPRYDSAVYRTQARACAAEYADRRADG